MGRGPQRRIKELQRRISGEQIKENARLFEDESSWTRRRNMPLEDVVLSTLGKQGLSTTMEVRNYFQAAEAMEREVSKQDYFQQRKKLNPEVFRVLNSEYLQSFYQGDEAKCWQGYVVLAIDGSRAEIPNSEENRKVYGESENQYGKAVARANISGLYDVFNRFFLDIGIHPFRSGEIAEGEEHIGTIREIVGERPVLVILDRGYGSLEMIDCLERAGLKYLIRLREWNYKAEVGRMEGEDDWIEIAHTKSRLRQLRKESPERAKELEEKGATQARIVKTRFGREERGRLVTNLSDIGADDIRQLYRERWGIEKKYHTLKNKMKFESVTGKASIYVEQDFWAQVLVYNILQDLITEADEKVEERGKEKGYRYGVRTNENIAIGLFKEAFVRLMLEEDDKRREEQFDLLKADMERNIVPIRTLESKPRKWNSFNKYKCNQKPSF